MPRKRVCGVCASSRGRRGDDVIVSLLGNDARLQPYVSDSDFGTPCPVSQKKIQTLSITVKWYLTTHLKIWPSDVMDEAEEAAKASQS